ncbi:MAG: hypothetical protein GY759_05090 [Chloroflexi bacterium]|nr:hypothetical protein [Chloroflexota bacterium]
MGERLSRTLCEATGIPIPAGAQGRSLWPILTGEPYSEAEFSSVYTELGIGGAALTEANQVGFGDAADTFFIDGIARTNYDGTQVAMGDYRRAIISDGWKLIYDLDLPTELYNLERYPFELNNLASDPHCNDVKQRLQAELLHWCIRLDDNLQVERYMPKSLPHNWRR